jgi:hypothetical protein
MKTASQRQRALGHRRVYANSNERIGDVLFTSISVVFL